MAKKLKERGIDIDLISETSGLSKDEIEKVIEIKSKFLFQM